MPTDNRLRALCLLAAALLAATLFASAPATGGTIPPPWDKLAHFAFYGSIALLLSAGFGRAHLALAVSLTCLVGVADESYQAILPDRHADPVDLLADFCAAGLVAVVVKRGRSRAGTPG